MKHIIHKGKTDTLLSFVVPNSFKEPSELKLNEGRKNIYIPINKKYNKIEYLI